MTTYSKLKNQFIDIKNYEINLNFVTYYETFIGIESNIIVSEKEHSFFGRYKGLVYIDKISYKSYENIHKAIENTESPQYLFASEGKVLLKPHIKIRLACGKEIVKWFPTVGDLEIYKQKIDERIKRK